MIIPSWMPKGSANRCPMCGNAARLKPSLLCDEAPCPCCGHLLWFFVFRGESHFFLPEEIDSLDLVELIAELEEDLG